MPLVESVENIEMIIRNIIGLYFAGNRGAMEYFVVIYSAPYAPQRIT